MPHFTVVPVEDKHRTDYDNLEGLSWVDYSEPGGAAQLHPRDAYDTVSSDGFRNEASCTSDAIPDPRGSPENVKV
ncbi:UNVERIFIED_CONTAM: hypothetical protein K2H54_031396 [Gekko kuhli]